MYVPSATTLTSGGFFYKRPDGTYDTIISAQHILKSMLESHKQQLAALPQHLSSSFGGTKPAGSSTDSNNSSSSMQPPSEGSEGLAGAPANGSLLDLVTSGLATDDDVSSLC